MPLFLKERTVEPDLTDLSKSCQDFFESCLKYLENIKPEKLKIFIVHDLLYNWKFLRYEKSRHLKCSIPEIDYEGYFEIYGETDVHWMFVRIVQLLPR